MLPEVLDWCKRCNFFKSCFNYIKTKQAKSSLEFLKKKKKS